MNLIFILLIVNKVTLAIKILTIIYYRNWLRDGDIFLNFNPNHPFTLPANA